ncbi:sulfotransferase domain-containing protein [Roseospira navarrensis]|uniref:Sulfotransferase domain-containing protein n=1 Tax=Roseospira navarrensis TaxID=140058 RepID=A0A7X1ZGH3_9PROT|nr:sulfotransferase domain-containing protein [Roseospira navarrensis]MQX38096.1 hypothetical protein [Roseospira navarrensis]
MTPAAAPLALAPATSAPAPLPPFPADGPCYARYTAPVLPVEAIPPDRLFIVNTLPKSGTVWMVAMLSHLLGRPAGERVLLSHVADLAEDLDRPQVHGAVVMVRDLRDVVVSWFHETLRSDARAGFEAARFPTVEAFYFEHLLGLLRTRARFAEGRFETWLDAATARGFPLLRYEDTRADPAAALRKVMTAWKITVPDAEIAATVAAHRFEAMADTARRTGGPVAEAVAAGHLRRGRPGGWREDLPDSVQADIARRFGAFQERLGYG